MWPYVQAHANNFELWCWNPNSQHQGLTHARKALYHWTTAPACTVQVKAVCHQIETPRQQYTLGSLGCRLAQFGTWFSAMIHMDPPAWSLQEKEKNTQTLVDYRFSWRRVSLCWSAWLSRLAVILGLPLSSNQHIFFSPVPNLLTSKPMSSHV